MRRLTGLGNLLVGLILGSGSVAAAFLTTPPPERVVMREVAVPCAAPLTEAEQQPLYIGGKQCGRMYVKGDGVRIVGCDALEKGVRR